MIQLFVLSDSYKITPFREHGRSHTEKKAGEIQSQHCSSLVSVSCLLHVCRCLIDAYKESSFLFSLSLNALSNEPLYNDTMSHNCCSRETRQGEE